MYEKQKANVNIIDHNQVAICFALQKMMPTPHITNSKPYYYIRR